MARTCSSVDGDMAQLVERRTATPLTQVRFPGAARDFFLRVNFQCRLFYVYPYTPVCKRRHYISAHVKDPVVHVRVRWIMETVKHQDMHSRLGSTTLLQLAFPGESNPNFPWGKSHWDNTVVKFFKILYRIDTTMFQESVDWCNQMAKCWHS